MSADLYELLQSESISYHIILVSNFIKKLRKRKLNESHEFIRLDILIVKYFKHYILLFCLTHLQDVFLNNNLRLKVRMAWLYLTS